SGKIVCTGGRSTRDVNEAVEKIHNKLKSVKAFIK
ncbi:hypothetical protein EPN87_01515, partial [archaeon]